MELEELEEEVRSLGRIGLDSNLLIYALDHNSPYYGPATRVVRLLQNGEVQGVISVIVEMELLVKPFRRNNPAELDRAHTLLLSIPGLIVRPMDREIGMQAAIVRAQTGLAPMDSIIMATALYEQCHGVIGNDLKIARRPISIRYLCLQDYM